MPLPAGISFNNNQVAIDSRFTVALTGQPDERLIQYVRRAIQRLEGRLGVQLEKDPVKSADHATLVIDCKSPAPQIPSLDQDESYSLEVKETQAVITANTPVGAMRGIETFLQCVKSDSSGYRVEGLSIKDYPRFRWRGLLIDVARHFEPVPVILRNIDGMAAVKLDVLHLHLTDDQGFRVESRKYPDLARLGSDGLYYTQDQIREIVSYAAARGIRVVPEFDMPGHVSSWLVSHPELASGPGPYKIERTAGIFNPALDPTNEKVYKFLDRFLGEMAGLFPDAYMHIGGDENLGKQWDANPKIQEFRKRKGLKDNAALQTYFNQRLSQILKKHHKRMVGWDEILNPELPKDAVIQSWRGPTSLAQAAKQGYDGILSAGYYIDLMYPAANHYTADPNPPGSGLTPQESAHILGGEATMWSEYVGPETIDSRIWPRTAAIAERLWSPLPPPGKIFFYSGEQPYAIDVDFMYRRLDLISVELEELGLTHNSYPDILLRRLAGTENIEQLKRFVDLLTPVTGYMRGTLQPGTTLSPLTNLVDAARPDRPAAIEFDWTVKYYLAFESQEDQSERIRKALTEWRALASDTRSLRAGTALFAVLQPLVESLGKSSEIGLQALDFLEKKQAPPTGWKDQQLAALKEAANPHAAVRLAIVPSIVDLVNAAANRK